MSKNRVCGHTPLTTGTARRAQTPTIALHHKEDGGRRDKGSAHTANKEAQLQELHTYIKISVYRLLNIIEYYSKYYVSNIIIFRRIISPKQMDRCIEILAKIYLLLHNPKCNLCFE